MLSLSTTTDPELSLLSYRLRKLREAGILTLSDNDWGMKTVSESSNGEFPDDPVVRFLLSHETDPAKAQICLWHILWQIRAAMPFGETVANGIRENFPNPVQNSKSFPTIYNVGEFLGDETVKYPSFSRNTIVNTWTTEQLLGVMSQPEGPKVSFGRFIAWRVQLVGKPNTFIHFTPLPEVV